MQTTRNALSMSTNHPPKRPRKTRIAANDNGGKKRRVEVRIPTDLPIVQTEIEAVAALLDDLMNDMANDNEGPEDDKAGSGICAGLDHASGRE